MAARLKEVKLYVSVYKTDVVLLIGPYTGIRAWMKKNLNKASYEYIEEVLEERSGVTGSTFHLLNGGAVIWMPKRDPAVLVHELFHVTHRMLSARSIPLANDTGEAYAYLLESMYLHFTK